VSDLSEPQLAQRIVELTEKDERKQVVRHFITPPTVFGIEGSRNTIVDQMAPTFRASHMPIPEEADEDIVGGWRVVFNCLRRARTLAGAASLTKAQIEEAPCLFIGNACEKLRDALPTLTRFEEDSELVSLAKRSSESYDDTSDACAEALRILCKSMLSARYDAPVAVRRREVWDSVEDPTFRGLRMAQFDASERSRKLIRNKRWRL
jgi:hypothetical protein